MRHFIVAALVLAAAAPVAAQDTPDTARDLGSGLASYFGKELSGSRTASGERCDPEALTAAHPFARLGARMRVTSLMSGLSVIVRINDRGPFHSRRVIDLSRAAARAIGLDRLGTGQVSLTLLGD